MSGLPQGLTHSLHAMENPVADAVAASADELHYFQSVLSQKSCRNDVLSNLPFSPIFDDFLHLDLYFLRSGGVLVYRLLDFLHLLRLDDRLGDGGPGPSDAAGQAEAGPGSDQYRGGSSS